MKITPQSETLSSLKWQWRKTFLGLAAERLVRAFWPLWTVILLVWALLASGILRDAPLELSWLSGVAALSGVIGAMYYAIKSFQMPSWAEALDRIDRAMVGRPISAALDDQAIGTTDAASQAVWDAHQTRMTARLAQAKSVSGDLRVSDRDGYGLRYIALLLAVLTIGLGVATNKPQAFDDGSLAENGLGVVGPSWEIWIEPPSYTGKPSLYLNDIDLAELEVPTGSLATVRLYGDTSQFAVSESVSGRPVTDDASTPSAQSFEIVQSGELAVEGAEDAQWSIHVTADARPVVEVTEEITRRVSGDMELPFDARDDYGIERGIAEIALDLDRVDRRYGLTIDPEPRDTVVFDLPMPIRGDRADFTEVLIENMAEHPWAGLPVTVTLTVSDVQANESEPFALEVDLPGRRFFQPVAKAVIEQRRDLLWSIENATRVEQILRTISHKPDGFFPSERAYLMLRMGITRLDIHNQYGLSSEKRDEIAELLWATAVLLEDGILSDALEALRRAQERLAEAMEDGATDEEIAELMEQLRDAMRDYMEQLAQNAERQDGDQQAQNQQQGEEITSDELQDMLDQIQELMEQGRMAEAQQLLNQLMEMMQNMQVARGQQGQQGQQGQGQQAMEGLQETLRNQQGLSDEAFRDLQEQFNDGAQAGENSQNQGRNGGQGRGQSHEGQGGRNPQQGQQGQGGGSDQAQNQQNGQGDGQESGSLADRQQALRNELERQRRNLPGAGTPEGDAARESLGRAGEAMDRAEDALRQNQTAEALGAQSDAMEALREGIRDLGEAMAQQQQQQGGQQGQTAGTTDGRNRDPLGREAGSDGMIGSEDSMLQGQEARRRAQELRDEIRKRSGEQERPDVERDYLKRLLDRF